MPLMYRSTKSGLSLVDLSAGYVSSIAILSGTVLWSLTNEDGPVTTVGDGSYAAAFAVLEQSEQEVDGLELGIAELSGVLLRLLYSLLRLDGEFFPTNGH